MKDKPPNRPSQYRVYCPQCRAQANVRTSRTIDDVAGVARELHVVCSNAKCGHVFGAIAEVRVTITHTIRPSAIPSADVTLRAAPLRPRPANDVPPPVPANDVRGMEVPRTATE